MSLYLRARIGAGLYLLNTEPVVEIRRSAEHESSLSRERIPTIDLREVFGENADAAAACVIYAQESSRPAALLINRAEGLIDLDDEEFRELPPIGPLGRLIDAVSTALDEGRPMLRLRAERAVAAIRPKGAP